MNYGDRRLRQLLAGEYVLGTLVGAARRRFERLVHRDPQWGAELRFWEQRLAALTAGIEPVSPPPEVWHRLARRAGIRTRPQRLPRERLWHTWAWLATAASVVLAVALALVLTRPAPPTYVAFLQVPSSSMHWTVALSPARHELKVIAGGEPPQVVAGKDAELWWLGAGGKPVALGVLPKRGQTRRPLPPDLPLSANGKLAVSIEPKGGSPTGQPTGPVILAAPVASTA